MMRSRRASALTRPQTNSDGEVGIHEAEEFISPPREVVTVARHSRVLGVVRNVIANGLVAE